METVHDFPLIFVVVILYFYCCFYFLMYGMMRFLVIFSFFLPFLFLGLSHAYQEVLIEERGGKAIRVIKVILDGEHFVVSSVAKE